MTTRHVSLVVILAAATLAPAVTSWASSNYRDPLIAAFAFPYAFVLIFVVYSFVTSLMITALKTAIAPKVECPVCGVNISTYENYFCGACNAPHHNWCLDHKVTK